MSQIQDSDRGEIRIEDAEGTFTDYADSAD